MCNIFPSLCGERNFPALDHCHSGLAASAAWVGIHDHRIRKFPVMPELDDCPIRAEKGQLLNVGTPFRRP
jgi:hypothetical protein